MMDVFSELNNGTVSTWFISPEIDMSSTVTGSFYTRTTSTFVKPDRMYVRYSTAGSSSNVGNTPDTLGDFTNPLLIINSALSSNGYPNSWTLYTFTIPARGTGVTGRVAFHYYVTEAGPFMTNGYTIGIDTVTVNANVICNSTVFTTTTGTSMFIYAVFSY